MSGLPAGCGPVEAALARLDARPAVTLRVEVEAFRAELDACGPDLFGPRLDDAARALSSGYHVGLDVHACRHLLTCPFPSDGSWPISPTGASLRSSSSPAVMGRSTDSIRR